MSLLGIDVGTSGCKAATFDLEGRVLGSAYREFAFCAPQPGWAELDPAETWLLVKDCIRQAVQGIDDDPVTALSVSSLGEAVVPVSADRRILGPSILNFDPRGAEFVDALRAAVPDEELYAFNGNTHGNHYGLTKLLWIKVNRPDLYAETDKFLLWSAFISFMLGAEPHVDLSLANRTLCFDMSTEDWSDRMRAASGLHFGKLPRPVPSGTVVGTVSANVADELGLPHDVAIVAGAHDQCANAIGCGVIGEGAAMYGMGTFACIVPVFASRPDPSTMTSCGLNTEHHAVPGRYVSFIYNQGGSLLKWYRDTFAACELAVLKSRGVFPLLAGGRSVSEANTDGGSGPPTTNNQQPTSTRDLYSLLLSEMPPGPSGVIVLPHFTTTGPPEFIADSCGLIAGLHLDTPRGRILKGILEGVTFYLREIVEALPQGLEITEYTAVGGGAKSDAWLQLTADIMGRPVRVPEVTEAGALGAALIAGVGTGVYQSYEEAIERAVRIAGTYEPDTVAHDAYGRLYGHFRKTAPAFREYLRQLNAL